MKKRINSCHPERTHHGRGFCRACYLANYKRGMFRETQRQKLSPFSPLRMAAASPSSLDIAWAAGIYEGEGSCSKSMIEITQNGRWLLDRLRLLFGGLVTSRRNENHFVWSVSGARARGFGMTIFKFLSPRRQEQMGKLL